MLSTGLGETLSFIASGKVRVLAVTAPKRVAAAGNAPTLIELGYPVSFVNWRGMFAPGGVATGTRGRHIERFRALAASPAWQAVLDDYGWQSLNLFGDDFSAYLEKQEALLEATMTKLGFLGSR